MNVNPSKTNGKIFRELSRWGVSCVFVLTVQILFIYWLFFLGNFINLNPIGQFLYAGAISWLGNLLFDDPFCGDNVLGLLMFLLTVMLYSVIAGTGLYLFRRYVSRETN